jgi:UDP-N-acetyl-D-glucosamine dehydrogenase
MKVATIGLGYVGEPFARLCLEKGHEVIGIDSDQAKLRSLEDSLIVTDNYSVIGEADMVCVCVPTPVYENHRPDLSCVVSACTEVERYLDNNPLVVIESTVNPGVCRDTVLPILEGTNYSEGQHFNLAHCPERINPGDLKWHVGNIPRVVGAISQEGLERAVTFYTSIVDAQVRPMSSIEATEAVKIMENAFRDVNIAFVNELATIYARLGIDITDVIAGASTKPFGFKPFFPGCGVGGHCIPVDPYYLIDQAEREGLDPGFLSRARKVNEGMPGYTVDLLISALNDVKLPVNGTTVGLLGLSYKPGIRDLRESPSLDIRKRLLELGANLRVYDPYVPEESTVGSIGELLDGCDAIVLATAHEEFLNLDVSGLKVVVDGRNFLDKDAIQALGVRYQGIGR